MRIARIVRFDRVIGDLNQNPSLAQTLWLSDRPHRVLHVRPVLLAMPAFVPTHTNVSVRSVARPGQTKHRQFGHPRRERLRRFLRSWGGYWHLPRQPYLYQYIPACPPCMRWPAPRSAECAWCRLAVCATARAPRTLHLAVSRCVCRPAHRPAP